MTDGAWHGERQIVLLGAGGHARVVADAWRAAGGQPIVGIVMPEGVALPGAPIPHSWVKTDSAFLAEDPAHYLLLNGIGLVPGRRTRLMIAERYRAAGFDFEAVVHPAAVIARDCRIADGAQVMAGAVLQTGTIVAQDAIINTGARVDHDCVIGSGAHIAPGAILCGNVKIGRAAFVGAGAVVLPGVRVGDGALVPAGLVLQKDLADGTRP